MSLAGFGQSPKAKCRHAGPMATRKHRGGLPALAGTTASVLRPRLSSASFPEEPKTESDGTNCTNLIEVSECVSFAGIICAWIATHRVRSCVQFMSDLVLSAIATGKLVRILFRVMSLKSRVWWPKTYLEPTEFGGGCSAVAGGGFRCGSAPAY